MGFFKKLFGSPSPRKPTKPAKKYIASKTDRAALIAEAMKVYREQRAQARGVLDKAVADFRAKPPSPVADREGTERLLALRQAHLDMGRLLTHDLKRFLVLAGIRQWLGEGRGAKRAVEPVPQLRH